MTTQPAVNIFVSYRRQDTSHVAGRLYDRLVDRFGPNHVFMDVDSIAPGSDFHEEINRAVGASDVVLALLGPGWATAVDDRGRRRLADPGDLVRAEIQAALEQHVRLIPVLVDGARMPDDDEIPTPLHPLRRRHAVRLEHATFRSDVENLVGAICRSAAGAPHGPATPTDPGTPPAGGQHARSAGPGTPPAGSPVPPAGAGTPPAGSHPDPSAGAGTPPAGSHPVPPAGAGTPPAGSHPVPPGGPGPARDARTSTAPLPVVRPTGPSGADPTARPARATGRRRALIAIGVVAVALAALVGWLLTSRQVAPTVAVPDLSRMTVAEAQQALADAGLVAAAPATAPVTDPSLVDLVVDQDPARGAAVAAGTTVSFTVGGALGPTQPPDTTTAVRPAPPPPATRPSRKISPTTTVSPPPDTGTTVDMPDVRGERIDDARATLAADGFTNVHVDTTSTIDDNDAGRVVDQSPSPGKTVKPTDPVVLTVGELATVEPTPA
jgi:TIR domain/PASTA domain